MISAWKNFLHPREKKCWYYREGSSRDVDSLGIKGSNLCEVFRMGLPTPAGFIIGAEASMNKPNITQSDSVSPQLVESIRAHVLELETMTSKTFGSGDPEKFPLLVAIRASSSIALPKLEAGVVGAGLGVSLKRQGVLPDSWLLPGVSSTALNVGINDNICKAIAQRAGGRFAYDTYARFLLYYGVIVHNKDPELYFDVLTKIVEKSGRDRLLVSDLQTVITEFKQICAAPDDPFEQILEVVKAIYVKWNTPEAKSLRTEVLGVSEGQGVAVIVSSMVYGNLSQNSGTGFMESRSSVDGAKELQVEFLSAAEGEDVIVSRRTPVNAAYLKTTNTILYKQLEDIAFMLEKQFRDSVSVEFGLQDNRLAVLQVRCGSNQRTTPVATLRILKDLVDEGVITEREAVLRVPTKQMQWFMQGAAKGSRHISSSGNSNGTNMDTDSGTSTSTFGGGVEMLGTGKTINYGTVLGRLAFTTADVRAIGDDAIFVTSKFDALHHPYAMKLARGVVILDEGVSSTAALIVRGLGKASMCRVNNIDICNGALVVDGEVTNIVMGSPVTLNASNATLYSGHIDVLHTPMDDSLFKWILTLCEKFRKMRITTNVESNESVAMAASFPCDGVLLHLDFLMQSIQERTNLVQFMLLAQNEKDTEACLAVIHNELLSEIKRVMTKLPGRTFAFNMLSAPLESFCQSDVNPTTIALSMNLSVAEVKERLASLHDTNPVLGLRGCRSFARFPRLLETCVQAIQDATLSFYADTPARDIPPLQITLPLMSTAQEVNACVSSIKDIVPTATVGATVATPRACLRVTSVSEGLDYVIFDALTLTELTWGCSHKDSDHFLDQYLHDHRFPMSPFESLDRHGVGKLINEAITKLRDHETPRFFQQSTMHHCEVSLAGLPGRFDPAGITFCHYAGITNFVSAPSSVALAKIVAAQLAVQLDMDEPPMPLFPIL